MFSQPATKRDIMISTWLKSKIGSNRHPWTIKIQLYSKPIVAKNISSSLATSGLTTRRKYNKITPNPKIRPKKILGPNPMFIISDC